MSDKYILNEHGDPKPEADLIKWARWFETAHRKVADENLPMCRVSTVFLGLNHNWNDGPPVLWETMVFGGPHNGETERCSGSREQAEAMHRKMVDKMTDFH